jgi:hypothetical protein
MYSNIINYPNLSPDSVDFLDKEDPSKSIFQHVEIHVCYGVDTRKIVHIGITAMETRTSSCNGALFVAQIGNYAKSIFCFRCNLLDIRNGINKIIGKVITSWSKKCTDFMNGEYKVIDVSTVRFSMRCCDEKRLPR